MKYFYLKIICIAVVIAALFTLSFRLTKDTEDNTANNDTAYNLSSWLAKHNIIIDKDIINLNTHYVSDAELINTIENKEKAAELILGGEASDSSADTYTGNRGTVVFSDGGFTLTPEKDVFKKYAERADRFTIGKRAEQLAHDMGFDVSGSVISSDDNDDGSLTATITKTINGEPIFDNCMKITVKSKKFVNAEGVWYVPQSHKDKVRTAKTASDALTELLTAVKGSGKVTVLSMTFGYKMKHEHNTTHIEPFWRFELSDREDIYIPA